jgi:hypothetical protein
MAIGRAALLRVVATCGIVLACSGESAPPGWIPEAPYVAMCSWLEGPQAGEYRARMAAALNQFADMDVVAASAAAQFPQDEVSVLFRRVTKDGVAGKVVEREHDTLRLEGRDAAPRLVDVTVDRDGSVHDAKPTEMPVPEHTYAFARYMATYIYFNELMADDRTTHRASCSETMRIQLAAHPSLIRAAEKALAGDASPDTRIVARIRGAYARFVADVPALSGAEHDLTQETVARLGDEPPITIVYRNREKSGDEADVVRIGTASSHTYAMFTADAAADNGKIGPTPLCITGDVRCARYYSWP